MAGGDVCSSDSFNEDIAVFAKQVILNANVTQISGIVAVDAASAKKFLFKTADECVCVYCKLLSSSNILECELTDIFIPN